MESLQDRVVVITGASAGIGRAPARELIGAGARVVLGARRRERLEAIEAMRTVDVAAGAARSWEAGPFGYGIVYGMERTTVYLTEAQKRGLERASRLTGRSEAELIREGVEAVTTRHQVTEPRLPLFESGQADLAENVDESLRGFGER